MTFCQLPCLLRLSRELYLLLRNILNNYINTILFCYLFSVYDNIILELFTSSKSSTNRENAYHFVTQTDTPKKLMFEFKSRNLQLQINDMFSF